MHKIRKRVIVWMTFQGGLKIVLSLWLALMIIFILTYELPATKTWTYWTMPLSGKVIALDAGHGGVDGGAKSKDGLVEKNINLGITLYLRDYLQQAGAVVVMTREEDKDLADDHTKGYSRRKTEDLIQRVQFVNQYKSDLFVSVHLNSIPSSRYSGAQTFYSLSNSDNPILATLIQNELKDNLLNTERVAKSAKTLYLLKSLKMPSALVEVGFLSNPEEAKLMADQTYQQKIAASIYQGILRYCSGEKVGSL
ncbi:MAG: N-acetylmuramoyl-L-alanine amidase CwlD [Paenibacillaceae bacterium]